MKVFTADMQNQYARAIKCNFMDHYTVEFFLDEGSFGSVYLARHIKTQNVVAVKAICREQLKKTSVLTDLRNEITTLLDVQHPNLIHLEAVFDDENEEHVFLVMEYANGGDLYTQIVKKDIDYTEHEARTIFLQTARAVHYLHTKNIVHRDLKPENIVLSSMENDAGIKIIDFGFATTLADDQVMTEICGTLGYIAPEILKGLSYNNRCDVWSLGIILYILLSGVQPFFHDDEAEEKRRVFEGDLHFPDESFADCPDAVDLLRNMLRVDPKDRFNMQQVLDHNWCAMRTVRPLEHVVSGLNSILAQKRWKKAFNCTKLIARIKICAQVRLLDSTSSYASTASECEDASDGPFHFRRYGKESFTSRSSTRCSSTASSDSTASHSDHIRVHSKSLESEWKMADESTDDSVDPLEKMRIVC